MHKAIWRIDRGVERHTVGAQNSEVENRSKPQCTAIGATVRRALNPSYENPTQPTRDHQWKTEPKLVDPSTKTPSRNPTMTPYPPSKLQDKLIAEIHNFKLNTKLSIKNKSLLRREAASKEVEDNVATSYQGTGAEQERSTVATSPREMRPQTLIARCLQLPNNPPNKANPENHERSV
ncbi:hypothetical protein F2Q68_00026475 [Brassica cretica]|uniref:Uncharacterized protein n=1 Tax=Brassica cretica TaxID=69181 RepID=A0A8S9IIL1_BRACR|nr:hypothetical protein F2Q68_00026475 [Brassica cretica]